MKALFYNTTFEKDLVENQPNNTTAVMHKLLTETANKITNKNTKVNSSALVFYLLAGFTIIVKIVPTNTAIPEIVNAKGKFPKSMHAASAHVFHEQTT